MGYGQVACDFESGSLTGWIFSDPGRWTADSEIPLSGSFSMHHVFDNPEAGCDAAGLPLPFIRPDLGMTVWQFQLRHGYDPSSLNNWGVYLFSDGGPAGMAGGEPVSGFVLGVNLTGYDDTLRLWRSQAGTLSVVASTNINWQTGIGTSAVATIVVERTIGGEWVILVGKDGLSPVEAGSGADATIFPVQCFGIRSLTPQPATGSSGSTTL
ncbi:MAG: hypothetical protein R2744_11080 [Bacteroidales bacterium]